MPFTLFHPALVLPLRRLPKQWISLTGLIAGSVAPDFEKFAKMKSNNHYSHTWLSLFYFTLPVGLALCYAFHLLIRNQLLEHLPGRLQQRLLQFRQFHWGRHVATYYPAVIGSVLLGGASHLLWDLPTHLHSPLIRWLPFLDMPYAVGNLHIKGFVLVNGITSLLGVGYLLWRMRALPPTHVPIGRSSASLLYWCTIIGVAALALLSKFLLFSTLGTIWDQIIAVFAALLLGLLLTSLLFRGLQCDILRPTGQLE